ncbi:PAS domain-containing sensor histidine kinase [Rhodopila sp.]|uniref:PAS domain-containing sensor histidine kinase n=1 Tax=Rhodopila sp. TaxID=2480087 RepID=UPI002C386727|nr:ATP-binding protein [Rhodopila sp.]HVZ08408.1 ATP-binding protein [Rhodopila sp.]
MDTLPADLHALLIDSVVDYAIFMLDREGRVASWNPGAERIKGYKAQEIIGQHFSRFYTQEDLLAEIPKRALHQAATEGRFTAEGWRLRKDGSRLWASVVIDPILRNGTVIGFAKVTRDLTERREAQEQLERSRQQFFEAQKMEAVGQLTGGLAHDFNNLLTAILGSLELARLRVTQGRGADAERHLDTARGAASRAAALTQRLLAFARRQTLDPRPISASNLVAGITDLIRRTMGPNIRVETQSAEQLWPALCDPNQLENAILNLCINARDAMPGGGRLTIELANETLNGNAPDQGLVPGEYVSVSVLDTGLGMPPEVQARAFEPFYTTKPTGQGTGLGLSMVYGFARQSGGTVRILSEAGQGTCVRIYLPRAVGAVVEDERPVEAQVPIPAASGQTVLVVDDEPAVRLLITEVLNDLGYTAIEAADGAGGLKVLQSNVRIDLLITDLGLPGDLNGRQMAQAGRTSRPNLKVLLITGFAVDQTTSGLPRQGTLVLTKPFSVDDLSGSIRLLMQD